MSVFSQMRSLARDVEHGLDHIKKATDNDSGPASRDSEKNNVAAVNEIRHKVKVMSDIKIKVKATRSDFELRNKTFTQVCDLFETALDSFHSRIEHTENYLELYGYKKPQSKEVVESVSSEYENGKPESENPEEDDSAKENVGEDPVLPNPPKDKQPFEPKLESLYQHLSKDAVMLLKQGSKAQETPKKSIFSSSVENLKNGSRTLSSLPSTFNGEGPSHDVLKSLSLAPPKTPSAMGHVPQPPKLKNSNCSMFEDEPQQGLLSQKSGVVSSTGKASHSSFDITKTPFISSSQENMPLSSAFPEPPKLNCSQDLVSSVGHFPEPSSTKKASHSSFDITKTPVISSSQQNISMSSGLPEPPTLYCSQDLVNSVGHITELSSAGKASHSSFDITKTPIISSSQENMPLSSAYPEPPRLHCSQDLVNSHSQCSIDNISPPSPPMSTKKYHQEAPSVPEIPELLTQVITQKSNTFPFMLPKPPKLLNIDLEDD